MRYLECLCGYRFNLSTDPDEEYIFVKARDYERLVEVIEQRAVLEQKKVSRESPEMKALDNYEIVATDERILECPQCKRLARWDSLRSNEIKNYTLEKVTKYKNLHFEDE